jgi:hypothetical protein
MPVIEAQRASILVPHDHRHISSDSGFGWPSDHVRHGIQDHRFGATPYDHPGDQVADHVDGYWWSLCQVSVTL